MITQTNPIVRAQYKALPLLVMLYVTIMLTSVVLVYKIALIGPVVIAASTLVIPFWYFLADVIAEVYGYEMSKKIIWSSLLCEFIFIFTAILLIHLPSPSFWHSQDAYNQVLGKLPRIFLGSILGIISSCFINPYVISRWKVLMHGKYFWLRSIGSSAIGEIIFTVVTLSVDLLGVIPLNNLMELMAISYGVKLAVNSLAVIPSSFLAAYLKRLEGMDIYDYNIEFNPFKMNSNESENFNKTSAGINL